MVAHHLQPHQLLHNFIANPSLPPLLIRSVRINLALCPLLIRTSCTYQSCNNQGVFRHRSSLRLGSITAATLEARLEAYEPQYGRPFVEKSTLILNLDRRLIWTLTLYILRIIIINTNHKCLYEIPKIEISFHNNSYIITL